MNAGAATPPPARARLVVDGARLLVDVLSRPDVHNRVTVRLPDGERRVVPARWLDPEDEAALDLLTSGDRVVQRAAPQLRAEDELRTALVAAKPITKGQAQALLRLPAIPTGPDRYLLSADGRRLWALCGDRVLSTHAVEPLPPTAPLTEAELAPRERTPRLRGEMVYVKAPTGKGTAAPRLLRAQTLPVRQAPRVVPARKAKGPSYQPPTAKPAKERLYATPHPFLGVPVRDIRPSVALLACFPGSNIGRQALRVALLEAAELDGYRATVRTPAGEVVVCYRLKQYREREPEWWAHLESEGPPPVREGERWLSEEP